MKHRREAGGSPEPVEFVEFVLDEHEAVPPRLAARTVEEVLAEVARELSVPEKEIFGVSRARRICVARQEFYRRAYRETSATMADLARVTGRTQPAVWQAIQESGQ